MLCSQFVLAPYDKDRVFDYDTGAFVVALYAKLKQVQTGNFSTILAGLYTGILTGAEERYGVTKAEKHQVVLSLKKKLFFVSIQDIMFPRDNKSSTV